MKKKIVIMSMLCLALTASASGQSNEVDSSYMDPVITSDVMLQSLQPTYLRNVSEGSGWDRNWFLEVKGGTSAFLGSPVGCGDLFDRLTPAVQVGIGKWFTPAVGGRIEFQGCQFKNAEFATMKYQFIHADFIYNLTAFISQNELGLSRWDVIPFLGIGMVHNSDWSSGNESGTNHPFAFAYGLEARYRITNRLHLLAELSGMTTMKNFDAIGSSSRFGDNMLTLSAGLSVTIGKVGHKRIIDAKPYMSQNEWLLDYANGLSSRNRYLTKRVHEDEQCMAEYRKILEIEGLLDLYKDRLTDKGHTKIKSLYPKNDYSGLNSLRARLANRGWDGNPNTMPRAMQKRNGMEDTEDIYSLDSLFNNSGVTDNAYLSAMLNGQEYIGAPIYFFFHLGTDVLTEKNQVMNLDEIARVANKHGLQVKVIGAADSATGMESINDNLSRQRAEYIRRLLLDRGVDDSRVYTIYAGGIDKYSPAEANRNTCVVLSF
jgi:outer membrane protein OmpA-like peptidoglycan-associated protein